MSRRTLAPASGQPSAPSLYRRSSLPILHRSSPGRSSSAAAASVSSAQRSSNQPLVNTEDGELRHEDVASLDLGEAYTLQTSPNLQVNRTEQVRRAFAENVVTKVRRGVSEMDEDSSAANTILKEEGQSDPGLSLTTAAPRHVSPRDDSLTGQSGTSGFTLIQRGAVSRQRPLTSRNPAVKAAAGANRVLYSAGHRMEQVSPESTSGEGSKTPNSNSTQRQVLNISEDLSALKSRVGEIEEQFVSSIEATVHAAIEDLKPVLEIVLSASLMDSLSSTLTTSLTETLSTSLTESTISLVSKEVGSAIDAFRTSQITRESSRRVEVEEAIQSQHSLVAQLRRRIVDVEDELQTVRNQSQQQTRQRLELLEQYNELSECTSKLRIQLDQQKQVSQQLQESLTSQAQFEERVQSQLLLVQQGFNVQLQQQQQTIDSFIFSIRAQLDQSLLNQSVPFLQSSSSSSLSLSSSPSVQVQVQNTSHKQTKMTENLPSIESSTQRIHNDEHITRIRKLRSGSEPLTTQSDLIVPESDISGSVVLNKQSKEESQSRNRPVDSHPSLPLNEKHYTQKLDQPQIQPLEQEAEKQPQQQPEVLIQEQLIAQASERELRKIEDPREDKYLIQQDDKEMTDGLDYATKEIEEEQHQREIVSIQQREGTFMEKTPTVTQNVNKEDEKELKETKEEIIDVSLQHTAMVPKRSADDRPIKSLRREDLEALIAAESEAPATTIHVPVTRRIRSVSTVVNPVVTSEKRQQEPQVLSSEPMKISSSKIPTESSPAIIRSQSMRMSQPRTPRRSVTKGQGVSQSNPQVPSGEAPALMSASDLLNTSMSNKTASLLQAAKAAIAAGDRLSNDETINARSSSPAATSRSSISRHQRTATTSILPSKSSEPSQITQPALRAHNYEQQHPPNIRAPHEHVASHQNMELDLEQVERIRRAMEVMSDDGDDDEEEGESFKSLDELSRSGNLRISGASTSVRIEERPPPSVVAPSPFDSTPTHFRQNSLSAMRRESLSSSGLFLPKSQDEVDHLNGDDDLLAGAGLLAETYSTDSQEVSAKTSNAIQVERSSQHRSPGISIRPSLMLHNPHDLVADADDDADTDGTSLDSELLSAAVAASVRGTPRSRFPDRMDVAPSLQVRTPTNSSTGQLGRSQQQHSRSTSVGRIYGFDLEANEITNMEGSKNTKRLFERESLEQTRRFGLNRK